ncbi:hypothetical protein JB92DRAFT_690409 [Gautieria morchelliformis]|nr:hypothetical protein JB92DRAFT_690409 [Gautieria morchelliformis]
MVSDFTKEDDERLVEYFAVNCPTQEDRGQEKLYKQLVQNPDQWPWSARHARISEGERHSTPISPSNK